MYNNTYQNNHTYGSPYRPVMFDVSKNTIGGVEVVILTASQPFFDELRYGCDPCSVFYGVICKCLNFGVVKPVYITDDGGVTFIPLRTKRAGFTVYSDEIQPYCGSRQLLKFLNAYDAESVNNNHINILSPIYPKHKTCDCSTTSVPHI